MNYSDDFFQEFFNKRLSFFMENYSTARNSFPERIQVCTTEEDRKFLDVIVPKGTIFPDANTTWEELHFQIHPKENPVLNTQWEWVYDVILMNKEIVAFLLENASVWYHFYPRICSSGWVAIDLPWTGDYPVPGGIGSVLNRMHGWIEMFESKRNSYKQNFTSKIFPEKQWKLFIPHHPKSS